MRAAQITEMGAPPVVAEIAEPRRDDGQTLVEVSAAALNPVDLSIASGRFYAGPPEVPFVPGSEGAGIVLESDTLPAGASVRFRTAPGYGGRQGSLAERVAVGARDVFVLNDQADREFAACLGVAGLAAWLALEWRAQLRAGETALVLGASGAVGQIGVQAAKILGAQPIVAAARDEQALERTRSLGADATVALGRAADRAELSKRLRAAARGDIDVVLDPLWGEPALAAFDALAPYGRLVNVGQSAGAEASISSAAVRSRARSLIGHSNFVTPHEVEQAALTAMIDHASRGELVVPHETFALDDVAAAWELQARGPHGKVAVLP